MLVPADAVDGSSLGVVGILPGPAVTLDAERRKPWFRVGVSPDLVMDAAFRGEPCELLAEDGTSTMLPTAGWAAPLDVSAEAVRQTRALGSPATHADVLSETCDLGGLASAPMRLRTTKVLEVRGRTVVTLVHDTRAVRR